MARYKLENELIEVEVDEHGAELKSLVRKDNETEYMWSADPKYWGRTSPVLFPFVGAVKDSTYRTKGKSYSMGQHGFARDMDFSLSDKTTDTLWFELKSNENTLEKYPHEFLFKIGYKIENNTVTVIWHVENIGSEILPFSVGGHPAFNNCKNSKLLFDVDGSIKSRTLVNGLAGDEIEVIPLNNSFLDVTKKLFDKDALVLENQSIHKVSLCEKSGKPYLTLTADCPLMGIWSPVGSDVPFVCIEPWYGRCDSIHFDGELCEREFGNLLNPSEFWEREYTIEAIK